MKPRPGAPRICIPRESARNWWLTQPERSAATIPKRESCCGSAAAATSITTPTPTFSNGLIIVSSGFIVEPVRPVTAFRPGATGDITLKEGESASNISPGAIHGSALHPISDRIPRLCLCAVRSGIHFLLRRENREGDLRQTAYRCRSQFLGIPVAAGGKLYLMSEDGDVYVISAGAAYELLAKTRSERRSWHRRQSPEAKCSSAPSSTFTAFNSLSDAREQRRFAPGIFQFQQNFFDLHASSVPRHLPFAPDHTMTRDNDRIGFAPFAAPTALEALGRPIRFATSP